MNRTLEILSLSSLLAAAALLVTSPSHDLTESKAEVLPQLELKTYPPEPKLEVDREVIAEANQRKKIQWCKERINCIKMAEALYFEARSEGIIGMQAVANVIVNRSKKSGRTIYGVITRPYQFSYLDRKSFAINEPSVYKEAIFLSVKAVRGSLEDITNGSTHYVAPKLLKKVPSWVKKLEKTVAINDHQFFRG